MQRRPHQKKRRWDYPDGGPAVSRVAEDDVERYWPPKRIADLVPGSAHRGKVVQTTSYGAFVDIGATRDGLLHISCLEDKEVRLGQELEVWVKSTKNGRLSLTMDPAK
eukprot:Skav235544  [mRNA]  locus=scaffold3067:227367:229193:+ [translate_table: standard]